MASTQQMPHQTADKSRRKRTSRWQLVALVTVLFTLLGTTPASAASGNGELISAFRTEVNHLENHERPAGFITPLGPPSIEICDALVVGTWFSNTQSTREELSLFTVEVVLDGAVLNAIQTPTRQRRLSTGERVFSYTLGVPVIGSLDEGVHLLEYRFMVNGVVVEVAGVDVESSPTHC